MNEKQDAINGSDNNKEEDAHATSNLKRKLVNVQNVTKDSSEVSTDPVTASASSVPISDNVVSCSTSCRISSVVCKTSTLFVGGLHRRITDAHLHKLFQPYGNVVRVFQVMHKDPGTLQGQPKGYAFVEYDSVESARKAIAHLDGRSLLSRNIAVRPAHQKTATDSNDTPRDHANNIVTDPKLAKKEKSDIEIKIMQVKMAIEIKKRKR